MSRQESDREDLIREATALRDRIEWSVPEENDPVVTGRRPDGRFSVFFGQDPVYQFNQDGQLRRAYVCGFLYRTQGNTLARLFRERTSDTTILRRTDLRTDEVTAFIADMDERLQALASSIESQMASVIREILESESRDFVSESLRKALTAVPRLAPAIPTTRNR